MGPSAQARLVLSGGIGSGKSTVAGMLAARGAAIIDSDEVGHRILDPDGPAFDAVAARWPGSLRDGIIDRGRLGAIVFANPEELRALEAITHPLIRAAIGRRVEELAASVVIVEVPLLSDLMGAEWRRVVVDAPEAIRRSRLERRGMTAPDVELRMAAQPTRRAWVEAADHVVDNSGSLDDLETEVAALWQQLGLG